MFYYCYSVINKAKPHKTDLRYTVIGYTVFHRPATLCYGLESWKSRDTDWGCISVLWVLQKTEEQHKVIVLNYTFTLSILHLSLHHLSGVPFHFVLFLAAYLPYPCTF